MIADRVKKNLALLLCALVTVFSCKSSLAEGSAAGVVRDAILYRVSDGVLEYNVTHAVPIAADVSVSGPDMDTLEALRLCLGEPDAPEPVVGTDPGQRRLGPAVRADLTLGEDGSVSDIRVTALSSRPVIGISWKNDRIGKDYQRFAEAFERGGACAVFLPQITGAQDAKALLMQVDGIFVTGGVDWDPALYGQTQTPHGSVSWNDVRDRSDLHLMQQAIALDVPMLCVCRGEQGLNIALGGALIQDIPSMLGEKVLSGEISPERVSAVLSGTLPGSGIYVQDTGYIMYDGQYRQLGASYDKELNSYVAESGCEAGHLRVEVDGIAHRGGSRYHPLDAGIDGIGISKDSKWLYDVVGSDSLEFTATSHHQAIDPDQLGKGLTVAAVSSDGIVEAVEYQANTFVLALQWHPERDALGDSGEVDADQDLSNAILGALIHYAGRAADPVS